MLIIPWRAPSRAAAASALLAAALLVVSCSLPATTDTQAARVYRIGYVGGAATDILSSQLIAGLAEHGYVEGQNLELLVRSTDDPEVQAKYAAELVGLRVDCLVSNGTPVVGVVREAA
ncbi:MAG TPA: hypothetical protein VGK54_17835, partial [Chloroflexota bacterium]